jgi:hypothetical protein
MLELLIAAVRVSVVSVFVSVNPPSSRDGEITGGLGPGSVANTVDVDSSITKNKMKTVKEIVSDLGNNLCFIIKFPY